MDAKLNSGILTLTVVVSAALLLMPPVVFGAGAASVVLEEVMVHGTKSSAARAAQDVPSQVAAFGSDQLEAMQVTNLEDLSFSTPNVYMDSIGTQKSYASFSIRGLGIDNSTPSIDPNVGVFIDGVYAGVGFGVVTDTFDLESVEVYKGPQSLLFGRNVTGGAVLLRSKRPTGEFNAKAKLGYEEGDQYTAAFAVEGALIEDVLAGRIAVQYRDNQGWFDNKVVNRDTGADTSEVFRGSLVYSASDVLELTFILEDGNIQGDGTPVQFEYQPVADFPTYRNPFTPSSDSYDIRHDFVGEGDVDWQQFTFETVYHVGPGQLTNTMAYRKVEAFASADADGASVTTSLTTDYALDQHQFTNELRYNLTIGDRWDTTIGVAYFTQEYSYLTGLTIAARDTNLSGNDRYGGGLQEQTSTSVYWNNEFRITDRFSIIGGANYLKEKKDVVVIPREASSNTPGVCSHLTESCNWSTGTKADDDWSNVSPKLGFTWQILEDAQVYGHITRAYRSGFFNLRTPVADDPVATDVEEHNAIELGIKSTLADGNIRLNGAVFRQKIDSLARSSGKDVGGFPVQDLFNVGDAEISGFEVDVLARVTDNLVLTAAVGYLDGDITKATLDINTDGVIDSRDESLAITRLSQWTTNTGVIYDLNIGNAGILTFRGEHSFRARAANRDDNAVFTPNMRMVNGGITFAPYDSKWSLSLYGRNLLDEVVYTTLFPLRSGAGVTMFAPVQEGRSIGLEWRYEL